MRLIAIYLLLESNPYLIDLSPSFPAVLHLCNGLSNVVRRKDLLGFLLKIPLEQYGFALHKGEFIDAICLRYGFLPSRLPSHCVCGKDFSLSHALSCPHGAFPSIRHNEIWNLTANLMSEATHNVQLEPQLHPLSGENLHYHSAIQDDDARVDIRASGYAYTIIPFLM